MQTLPAHVNPFAMLLDPQAMVSRIEECSLRLERLQRRVCRPLDKPLLGAGADDDDAGDNSADGAANPGPDDSCAPGGLRRAE